MSKATMPFAEFINRLLNQGFVEGEFEKSELPYVRTFQPPRNLQSAFTWLNTGGTSLEDYMITVQGSDGEELGGDCCLLYPNEELIAALQAGSGGFLRWFNFREICEFRREDGSTGEVVTGVITADGKTHTGEGPIN